MQYEAVPRIASSFCAKFELTSQFPPMSRCRENLTLKSDNIPRLATTSSLSGVKLRDCKRSLRSLVRRPKYETSTGVVEDMNSPHELLHYRVFHTFADQT